MTAPPPRPRLSLRLALALASLTGALAFLLAATPIAQASEPVKLSGKAAGCEYSISITVEAKGGSYSAETKKCASGAITAKLKGSYKENYVELGSVEGSLTLEGHTLNLEESLKWGFTLPGSLLNGYTLETLLTAIVAKTQSESAAQKAIDALLEKAMIELGEVALEKLAEQVGGPLAEAMEPKEKMEKSATEYCESADELDPFCEEGKPTTAQPKSEPNGLSEEEADDAAMCPVNLVQKAVIFVCLPSFVMGNLETGSKPLVLLPGGMLLCLPIGGEGILSLSTTPTISSKKAIISLGGVIVGVNAKLKASDLGLSAGIVDMAGKLTLEGTEINAGTVDIAEAIGSLPSEITNSPYYKGYEQVEKAVNLPSPIPTTGSFSVPLLIAASSIEVSPSKSLQVGSETSLSTSGRGGAGGTPAGAIGGLPGGEAPGGAKDDYGGSHGGYGGIPATPFGGWEAWGTWQEPEGRGPAFDSPFAPSEPGAGGSGTDWDSVGRGASGGGVIRINGPKASLQIGGSLAADGEGAGYSPSGNPYTPEGAGAGGSIYITAKSVSGDGEIVADGGSYDKEAFNSSGGLGGGGRIALIYGEDPGWSGKMHAHGGVDEQYEGLEASYEGRGSGGAGTVFTRQVAFEESSVKEGKGEFPEGILTVDGGLPAGYFPPPDGTPIEDSWGNEKRKLVLTGEARAYAQKPDFGSIEVLNGSDLTSGFQQRLEVSAGTLTVDATSRIDVSDRGYKGGEGGMFYDEALADAGETAPGMLPATRLYGGSHGGAGGTRVTLPSYFHPEEEEGNLPGATYDSATEPSLPGGGGAGGWDGERGNPGGGVLDVTASTLHLEGQLSANGEDGSGPNVDDPTSFSRYGGAGAGGSVLLHAARLTGKGVIEANGGSACLAGGPPSLLAPGNGCYSGTGGGGGGGRVAVYATSCEWTGTLSAQGGVNQETYEVSHQHAEDEEGDWKAYLEESAFATGGEGSVFFQEEPGSCVSPQEPGSGEPGSGQPPPSGNGGEGEGDEDSGEVQPALTVGKANAKGSKVLVPLTCAQALCKIQIELSADLAAKGKGGHGKGKRGKGSQGKGKPKATLVGKRTLELREGDHETASLTLNATGRRLLKSSHKLKVKLQVLLLNPTSVVRTATLTLSEPKRHAHHKQRPKHRARHKQRGKHRG